MLMSQLKILIVDDEESVISIIKRLLPNDCDSIGTTNPFHATSLIADNNVDVVLLDIKMPGVDAKSILCDIKERQPQVEVIMVSVISTADTIVDYVKLGAFSYIVKNNTMQQDLESKLQELTKKIEAIRHDDACNNNEFIIGDQSVFIGKNNTVNNIFNQAKRMAPIPSLNILITGETGVGKEYLARYIHFYSDRSEMPFVAINCGAIPQNLIESELFGHEKGAFTDATMLKIGKFEYAHGGTVFLDEIGTMPIDLQVRLLRVLQEKVIERVGGNKEIATDFRIIAATNTNLKKEIREKTFREDVYYRLNQVEFHLPPLRDRRDDFEDIFNFLLKKHCDDQKTKMKVIEPMLMNILKMGEWRGNIRELDSLAQILVCLFPETDDITVANFPREWTLKLFKQYKQFKTQSKNVKLQLLSKLLHAFDGNISATATFLKMDRSTLHRFLKQEKCDYLNDIHDATHK